jgi:hypothetical protein
MYALSMMKAFTDKGFSMHQNANPFMDKGLKGFLSRKKGVK